MNLFDYSKEYQWLYVSGDIHGELKTLVFNIKRYDITNAVVVVAGDCGIGFERMGYYEQLYRQMATALKKNNIMLLLVRGNHDDPEYFDKQLIDFPRMKTVPDYSIVLAGGRTVLCIGGGISVDRKVRLDTMRMNRIKGKPEKKYYWENEAPTYNEPALSALFADNIRVDMVISHTAPSFCYPYTKESVSCWCWGDENLEADVQQERQTMDTIYNKLVADKHPVMDWVYGHFHASCTEFISGIRFSLLDIEELKELT